jgi:hypothetical protein
MHCFQVGKPASFGFIMGMGDIVAGYRPLAADFANFRHDFLLLSHSPSQWQTVEVECVDDVRANNESEFVLLPAFYEIGKHNSEKHAVIQKIWIIIKNSQTRLDNSWSPTVKHLPAR